MANLLKLAKATINGCQWHITININYFAEINYYFAGWLSGADIEVLQLTDMGNAIRKGMEKIKPEGIKMSFSPTFWKPDNPVHCDSGRTNKDVIACVYDHQFSKKFDEIAAIDHNDKG
jgi:hypothetical protein